MREFKIGDVVELNSGSPHMTVRALTKSDVDGSVMIGLVWYSDAVAEFCNVDSSQELLRLVKSAD